MSESQLKFASFDEAIDHLSEVTGKRVKIAWTDESKDILKAITEEIKKNPSLVMKKFKNYAEKALDPGVNVRSTTHGQLRTVEDVDEELMNKMLNSIKGAPRSEIFSIVQKDKESFPEFHKTYKKGLQEQNGNYRGKPGLIQRGKDWLSGEKGEKSKEDQEKAEEKDLESKRILKAIKNVARRDIKKLENNNAKNYFDEFFSEPKSKALRELFITHFVKGIEDGKIDSEEANKYKDILDAYMTSIKSKLDDEVPEFVALLKKFDKEVEKEVEEAEKEAPMSDEEFNKLPPKEKADKINQDKYAPVGSDEEQVIDGLINVWTEANLPKGE